MRIKAKSGLKEICIVCTNEFTLSTFFVPHILELQKKYKISIITKVETPSTLKSHLPLVDFYEINIFRKPNFLADLLVLFKLIRIFFSKRFYLVISITPKAGLLAMIASKVAGISKRLHFFTGQVWVTRSGMSKFALKALDQVIGYCATDVLVDSRSQMGFLVKEKVVDLNKASVIASGSVSGVDLDRFYPDSDIRKTERASNSIPPNAIVFLFLGRLTRDKGVFELLQAYIELKKIEKHQQTYLLLVGPDEDDVRTTLESITAINKEEPEVRDSIKFFDVTSYPEVFFQMADVLCLPSHREGFGTVVIEAAACEIPTIASRIYGLEDAVLDEHTGLLHEVGNINEITSSMKLLVENVGLRNTLANNAYNRVVMEFDQKKVVQSFVDYVEVLVE